MKRELLTSDDLFSLSFDNLISLANKKHDNKYTYDKVNRVTSHTKLIIHCPTHGTFTQHPRMHIVRGQGCPKCSGKQKTTKDVINEFKRKHGDKYDYSKVVYENFKSKLKIICPIHGEILQTRRQHLRSSSGCQKCSGKQKTTKDAINEFKRKHGDKYDYSKVVYENPIKNMTIICPMHGEFRQNWHMHMNGVKQCPKCHNNSNLLDVDVLIERFNVVHENEYDYSLLDQNNYSGLQNAIPIQCNEHGVFMQRPDNHLRGSRCPRCSSNNVLAEQHIVDYLESIGINGILTNDRQLIKPNEIDIYVPAHKLAIEYNGLYWHQFHDNTYHISKTKKCDEADIQLLHIFEDDWLFKRNIVKSRLKAIFNKNNIKIGARQCRIEELSSKRANVFFTKNHIQQHTNGNVYIGLFYRNILVAAMSFCKSRKILGNKKYNKDSYELLRFATLNYVTVIGAASKLFKYFVKTYNPQEVISYADRCWSVGDVYKKLGFAFVHNTPPNYAYIIDKKREPRYKFQKHKLVQQGYDKNMTEKQIMESRNIPRIYDCGSSKWRWTPNKV